MKRTLVIAVLAVAAVAAASVAHAAIPSANGTISACLNGEGELKIIDAEAGTTCKGNQDLLTWNQKGPSGPAGNDGVSDREVVTAESASDSVGYKFVEAKCPSGKVPVGGGGAASGALGFAPDAVALQASYPSFDGTRWVVTANETVSTSADWTLTARVICVSAS